ncbi:threonine synthase [Trichothermofontia sp.]
MNPLPSRLYPISVSPTPVPPLPYSLLSHLECARCQQRYEADHLQNICACGSPLVARYNLSAIAQALTPADLARRSPSLWRYHELLPIQQPSQIVSLGEGFTPLYPLPRLAQSLGVGQLWIKDESVNPGDTFKARGAAVGISRAIALGAEKLAIATNGNAGEAWALYAARAGVPLTVIMPRDANPLSQRLCAFAGAKTYLVDGLIADAGKWIQQQFQPQGWFDVSTLKEPYRLEGKKTMGYEIVEQLGWQFPDAIVFPTGGGIAIIAMYKAFLELQALGWVQGPLPRLIAVQAKGCAPLVQAFHAQATVSEYCQNAQTFATGLRVPKSFGDFMVLEALYATHGYAIAVSDADITATIPQTLQAEGVFLGPEAAVVVPAMHTLVQKGILQPDDRVVILGSGSGFKYPNLIPAPDLTVLPREVTGDHTIVGEG